MFGVCQLVIMSLAKRGPHCRFLVSYIVCMTCNAELNDLRRKITCWRKSYVSVERILVCNVIENLTEHGKRCLPCSNTKGVIDTLS